MLLKKKSLSLTNPYSETKHRTENIPEVDTDAGALPVKKPRGAALKNRHFVAGCLIVE